MWHARILFLLGTWLIVSGLLSPLQHPANMLLTGFFTVIYCFSSSRLWQAPLTGIVGLGLFLSGLNDWMMLNGGILVTQLNFMVSGGVLVIISLLSLILLTRTESAKRHLKVS